jgi:hypothetical protein
MKHQTNPYPPGTVTHTGWQRGYNEAQICAMFDVPMSLVLVPDRGATWAQPPLPQTACD